MSALPIGTPQSDDEYEAAIAADLAEVERKLHAAANVEIANPQKLYAMDEFLFDAKQEAFWHKESAVLYRERGVNSLVPRHLWVQVPQPDGKMKLHPPSAYLPHRDHGTVVESSTWWPGQDQMIRDRLIDKTGEVEMPGARLFNTYRPPPPPQGDPTKAGPWLDHVRELFPDHPIEALLDGWAHMLQRPGEKLNRIVVLLGEQGIGKDTCLLPLRLLVGGGNCEEIGPDVLFSDFNPHVQTILLVVNEARPYDTEYKQTAMYEVLKPLGATPPDWLRMNDKHRQSVYVRNVVRVHVTSNRDGALFIPPDDRRMFVLKSPRLKGWKPPSYFVDLYRWMLHGGGVGHVGAFLAARDLSTFNAAAEPPRTDAWRSIVGSWQRGEGDPVRAALSELGFADVVFGADLLTTKVGRGLDTEQALRALLKSNVRLFAAMREFEYDHVPRPAGLKEWRWRAGGADFRSAVAFVRRDLDVHGAAAQSMVEAAGRSRVNTTAEERPSSALVESGEWVNTAAA